MNVKKAKANRKMVYGSRCIRDRQYFVTKAGQVLADPIRRIYQLSKRVSKAKIMQIMDVVAKKYLAEQAQMQ
jgi:hypothetical protein